MFTRDRDKRQRRGDSSASDLYLSRQTLYKIKYNIIIIYYDTVNDFKTTDFKTYAFQANIFCVSKY